MHLKWGTMARDELETVPARHEAWDCVRPVSGRARVFLQCTATRSAPETARTWTCTQISWATSAWLTSVHPCSTTCLCHFSSHNLVAEVHTLNCLYGAALFVDVQVHLFCCLALLTVTSHVCLFALRQTGSYCVFCVKFLWKELLLVLTTGTAAAQYWPSSIFFHCHCCRLWLFFYLHQIHTVQELHIMWWHICILTSLRAMSCTPPPHSCFIFSLLLL